MSFRSSKRKENARKRWKPTLKREVFDRTSESPTALEKSDPRFTKHDALLLQPIICGHLRRPANQLRAFHSFCLPLSIIWNPLWGFSNHKLYQRSFAVFHPIMYVTQRSFAVPAPAIRDFFWLYHTYSLLRGVFYNASSGFGLWAKSLWGQLTIVT